MDKDIQNEKILVDKVQNDLEFVAGLIQALKENPDFEVYQWVLDGQEVLKNVTFGGVITTVQGSYEIYLDSQKYAGKDLYKTTVINVDAIGLFLWTSSKFNENVPEEFGYAIPLLYGGMVYLIDKGKNAVKEPLISKSYVEEVLYVNIYLRLYMDYYFYYCYFWIS